MFRDFSYFLPVRIEFGWGKLDSVGDWASLYGHKALLVIGSRSVKESGVLDRIMATLALSNVDYAFFSNVSANPTISLVEKGVKTAKREGIDVIIAVGGGSVIDCAKAISFGLGHDGPLQDYMRRSNDDTDGVPVIAIPTTCGTGSECTPFAVLTIEEKNDKRALMSMSLLPKVSIVDSSAMMGMPHSVFAPTVFDALCHNMEAFMSSSSQPLVNNMALYGIELFQRYMRTAYDSTDSEAWRAMALASSLGGMNIAISGVTALHGLEHPVSGLRNVTHGAGLAILTPEIFERTKPCAPETYDAIGRALGVKDREDVVPILKDIIGFLGLPTKLRDVGVQPEDIPFFVKQSMRSSRGAIMAHPRLFSKEEIKEIYEACL